MRATENSRARALAAGLAERAARVGVSEQRLERGRDAVDVARLDEQARLAVDDDLRHGADPRRDDRQAGQHRLEQDDPEPLPARRVDEDVRALEPVADLDAGPGRTTASPSPSSRDELPRLGLRAGRRRGSRAAPPARRARTRANARSSVAWSFCAISRPTASASGASAGIPAASGVELRRARRAARRARSASSRASPGRGPPRSRNRRTASEIAISRRAPRANARST